MNTILVLSMKDVKKQLHALCADQLKTKIKEVNQAIELQKESSAGDSKSSAGDKYETGTAMTHIELEKLGNQLRALENSLSKLNSFQDLKPSKTIRAGSLVRTNRNLFWISIGVGEVSVENQKYYVISPLSPIAQQFLGKEVGFEFVFNTQKDCILEVL
jgi:transcription elongation GreA/GreB family factor